MQVLIHCPVTYVTVPIADLRWKPAKTGKAKVKLRGKTAFWGSRGRRRKIISKKRAETSVSYCKWPVLNPSYLFGELIRAGATEVLQSQDWSWRAFWEAAERTEDWCRNHPVLSHLDPEQRDKAVAAAFHGDEGQGKRNRNMLVLSWSSIGVHGRSEHTKLPFCVAWVCMSLSGPSITMPLMHISDDRIPVRSLSNSFVASALLDQPKPDFEP